MRTLENSLKDLSLGFHCWFSRTCLMDRKWCAINFFTQMWASFQLSFCHTLNNWWEVDLAWLILREGIKDFSQLWNSNLMNSIKSFTLKELYKTTSLMFDLVCKYTDSGPEFFMFSPGLAVLAFGRHQEYTVKPNQLFYSTHVIQTPNYSSNIHMIDEMK